MNILDILKKYTDDNHRLSQKVIVEILDNEYDMKTDIKKDIQDYFKKYS